MGEMNRRLQDSFGLSPTAGMVLSVVEGSPDPPTASTIAERLIVSNASVTSLLDTLEARGLITRRRDDGDRRRTLVELTDQAHEVLDDLLPGLHQLERRVFATLTGSERRQFERMLDRLHDSISEVSEESNTELSGERHVPPRIQVNRGSKRPRA